MPPTQIPSCRTGGILASSLAISLSVASADEQAAYCASVKRTVVVNRQNVSICGQGRTAKVSLRDVESQQLVVAPRTPADSPCPSVSIDYRPCVSLPDVQTQEADYDPTRRAVRRSAFVAR